MEKEFSKKGSDAHGKDGGVPENKFKSGRKTDLGDTIIDFKNVHLLRRFVTDRGKINPARINRLSSKEQRTLASAIKRARHMALLPYCSAHHGMKND